MKYSRGTLADRLLSQALRAAALLMGAPDSLSSRCFPLLCRAASPDRNLSAPGSQVTSAPGPGLPGWHGENLAWGPGKRLNSGSLRGQAACPPVGTPESFFPLRLLSAAPRLGSAKGLGESRPPDRVSAPMRAQSDVGSWSCKGPGAGRGGLVCGEQRGPGGRQPVGGRGTFRAAYVDCDFRQKPERQVGIR